MATYWTAEVTPLAVTSLIPMFMFPMLSILPAARTLAHYVKDVEMGVVNSDNSLSDGFNPHSVINSAGSLKVNPTKSNPAIARLKSEDLGFETPESSKQNLVRKPNW